MRGRITSRERCPVCGAKGKWHIQAHGRRQHLVCQCGGWEADRPEIVLSWRGKTYRITHDRLGDRFATLAQTQAVQTEINKLIEDKRRHFDPAMFSASPKLRFEVYLEAFLARQEGRIAPSNIRAKRSYSKWLAWFHGRHLAEITTGDVEDYLALPCLNLFLSDRTRSHIAVLLAQVFRDAVRRNEIDRAPEVPRVNVDQKRIPYYTSEEQAKVLEHAGDDRPIIEFAMLYGWRPAEVVALCWDCIDFERQEVWCRRSVAVGVGLKESTKTRRIRPLPLYDRFAAILEEMPRGIGKTSVFVNPRTGRAYTTRAFSNAFHRAREKAEVRRIPLKNATRHSRGMQMVQAGVDSRLVSYALGHSKASTTERFYARPEPAMLKEIVDGPIVKPLSSPLSKSTY